MAARYQAWVYGRSLGGTAGSNPAGAGCLSVLSVLRCQVEVLRGADHSSRGVVPSVVCLSAIVKT